MKKTRSTLIPLLTVLLCFILGAAVFANAIGDIDNNGRVEAADARLALRAAVGLETLNAAQKDAADVDDNGRVEAADARLILRAAVGLEKLKEKTPPVCKTHSFGEWKAKTNSYGLSAGQHERVCTVCGAKETANCDYKNAVRTYSTDNHEPTCTENAIYYASCNVCAGKKIFTLPATGHYEITQRAEAPTCTQTGKTKGIYCEVCGTVLLEQKTVEALGHDYPSEWTVSADKTEHSRICKREGCSSTEKHTASYTLAASVLGNDLPTPVCTVCKTVGNTDKAALLNSFNKTVNSLKGPYMWEYESDAFVNTFAAFSKTTMSSDVSNINFAKVNVKNKDVEEEIKKMFSEEMDNEPSYTPLVEDRCLISLPLTDTNPPTVSKLTEADVKSIEAKYYPTLSVGEILKDYPDSYTLGSGEYAKTYSLAKFKDKTLRNVIAYTVTVPTFVADSISEFDALSNGQELPIDRISAVDIRNDIVDFDAKKGYTFTETEEDDLNAFSLTLKMSLTSLKADCTVTYYFDAETLAPIMAIYKTDSNMAQDIAITFELLNTLPITGTMKTSVETKTDRVYLFSACFN